MTQQLTIAHYKHDVGPNHHFPITFADVGEGMDIPYVQRRFKSSPNNRNNKMDYLYAEAYSM